MTKTIVVHGLLNPNLIEALAVAIIVLLVGIIDALTDRPITARITVFLALVLTLYALLKWG